MLENLKQSLTPSLPLKPECVTVLLEGSCWLLFDNEISYVKLYSQAKNARLDLRHGPDVENRMK